MTINKYTQLFETKIKYIGNNHKEFSKTKNKYKRFHGEYTKGQPPALGIRWP